MRPLQHDIRSSPHLNIWPKTEGKEVLCLSTPQQGSHIVHDQFEVFVVLKVLEVLVNVLVSSVIPTPCVLLTTTGLKISTSKYE